MVTASAEAGLSIVVVCFVHCHGTACCVGDKGGRECASLQRNFFAGFSAGVPLCVASRSGLLVLGVGPPSYLRIFHRHGYMSLGNSTLHSYHETAVLEYDVQPAVKVE